MSRAQFPGIPGKYKLGGIGKGRGKQGVCKFPEFELTGPNTGSCVIGRWPEIHLKYAQIKPKCAQINENVPKLNQNAPKLNQNAPKLRKLCLN